ncbi:hypothetical protein [Methanobrevibacter sp.]|nr:hypothetical protein [Methanobrevibacter sp.]
MEDLVNLDAVGYNSRVFGQFDVKSWHNWPHPLFKSFLEAIY